MANGNCRHCGKETRVFASSGRPHKFCSKKCSDAGRTNKSQKSQAQRKRDSQRRRERIAFDPEYRERQRTSARVRKKRSAMLPHNRLKAAWSKLLNRMPDYTMEEFAEYHERVIIHGHATPYIRWKESATPIAKQPRICNPWDGLDSAAKYRVRYHQDIGYRIRERMRSQFRKWITGERKAKPSFMAALNYDWTELRRHLERQFLPGMTWDNMGAWHIDHITPKREFSTHEEADIRACWSLYNLRPCWAAENQRKHGVRVYLL